MLTSGWQLALYSPIVPALGGARRRMKRHKFLKMVVILGSIVPLVSCAPQANQNTNIGMVAFKEAVDNGAYILDVREDWEYAEMHIKGSTLIPLNQLVGHMNKLPDKVKIHVICRSGNRSRIAVEKLQKFNKQAVNVEGGLNEWIDVGYPVIRKRSS